MVYVDNATSRLMLVRFTGAESTFAYFEANALMPRFIEADTPENRRLIGKYLEVFTVHRTVAFEIRVAGRALPYSVYNKLGPIDLG